MRRSGPVHARIDYNCSMFLPRIAIALALALAVPAVVASPGHKNSDDRPAQVGQRGGLSLDEAVAKVERRFEARAIKAETRNAGGRRSYRIRLLSADGRVFEVSVDAASGRVE
jgi:hypothetical protein